MEVLDACDNLVKELLGLRLLHSLILYDVIEELAAARILHDQVELLGSLDDLIELDDVRVPYELEDVNFPRYPLNIAHILNLLLFEDFDRDLLPS